MIPIPTPKKKNILIIILLIIVLSVVGVSYIVFKIKREKDFVYFEIKDNGVGIPKEDQKYIFQKFFRSENILRYQTQGSGLGLYISKNIVKRHGGDIWATSTQGRGSVFSFALPTDESLIPPTEMTTEGF